MAAKSPTKWVQRNKHRILWGRGLVVALAGAIVAFIRVTFDDPTSQSGQLQERILSFLGDPGIAVLIFLPLGLLVIVDGIVSDAERRDLHLPHKIALSLLTAFDRVVSTKTERFHRYSPRPGEDMFLAITQPDAQIRALMTQLYHVFRALTDDENIRLVLAPVESGRLVGPLYNAPEDAIPAISDADLNTDTFLSYIHSSGKVVYIPNLGKEKAKQEKNPGKKKRFLFLGEDRENEGGILGFSIKRMHNHKTTIYVLSIRSEDILIDTRFIEQSKVIVEKFQRRIQLESELARLRRIREGQSDG